MELDKRGAELLCQVLAEREEKASVAIASNEAFSVASFVSLGFWRKLCDGFPSLSRYPAV